MLLFDFDLLSCFLCNANNSLRSVFALTLLPLFKLSFF